MTYAKQNDGTMSDLGPTKEDVQQFIKENGPVTSDEILEHFDCQGDNSEIQRNSAGMINEYWLQLLDENKIKVNAAWEYEHRELS